MDNDIAIEKSLQYRPMTVSSAVLRRTPDLLRSPLLLRSLLGKLREMLQRCRCRCRQLPRELLTHVESSVLISASLEFRSALETCIPVTGMTLT